MAKEEEIQEDDGGAQGEAVNENKGKILIQMMLSRYVVDMRILKMNAIIRKMIDA